jgi:preprotein translocase subunit SecG
VVGLYITIKMSVMSYIFLAILIILSISHSYHEHQLPSAQVMVRLTSGQIIRSRSQGNFLHQMYRILRTLYYLNLLNNAEA